MSDAIKTPQWVIPIAITAIGALVTTAISWGSMSVRQDTTEAKLAKIEDIAPIVAQQQVLIPEMQKTLGQVQTAQIAFNLKYDNNRETDQKFYQELLKEVKKA